MTYMTGEALQVIGTTQSSHELARQMLCALATHALLLILRARPPAALWRSVRDRMLMCTLRRPACSFLLRRRQRCIRIATAVPPMRASIRVL